MAKNQKGQVILLTLLFIGSSILIFSTIAGYMMIQRIRASSDTMDSTKAIFAADSGVECMLFKYASTTENRSNLNCNTASSGFLSFDDNFVSAYTEIASSSVGSSSYIKSVGTSNRSKRAFYLSF
ncbi:MAG: hypothetical protein NUV83_01565 [Candidatus Wolfebacteria bacterium]|nr:hypothetical protein [Candidatus Wolfebacteria bacterium]